MANLHSHSDYVTSLSTRFSHFPHFAADPGQEREVRLYNMYNTKYYIILGLKGTFPWRCIGTEAMNFRLKISNIEITILPLSRKSNDAMFCPNSLPNKEISNRLKSHRYFTRHSS